MRAPNFLVHPLAPETRITCHIFPGVVSGMRLLKAVDQHNDDSLLLGQVPQQQLRKLILPLGEFTQEVIESISEQLGFDKLNDVSGLQDVYL